MTTPAAPAAPATPAPRAGGVRITANLFGIPFGFAGLALVWRAADLQDLGVPRWPAVVLDAVAAALLVVLAVAWLRQLRRTTLADELADAVLAPFLSLAPTVVVLVGSALVGYGIGAGRAVVVVGVLGIVALAAWITGGWLVDRIPVESLHAGWYLPTVAGGLISGSGLATSGWHRAGLAAYAVGLVFFVVIGTLLLGRLTFGPPLPDTLQPTMFILASPAAVAGNAWFVITGGGIDVMQLSAAGTTVLLVLAQVRLLPVYRRLPFAASFWSFSFSSAAIATYAVHWLQLGDVPGRPVLVWVVLALVTGLFGWLVVGSARLVRAGTFLPRWPDPRGPRSGEGGARPISSGPPYAVRQEARDSQADRPGPGTGPR